MINQYDLFSEAIARGDLMMAGSIIMCAYNMNDGAGICRMVDELDAARLDLGYVLLVARAAARTILDAN